MFKNNNNNNIDMNNNNNNNEIYIIEDDNEEINSILNWGEKDDNEFIKHENKEALQHHNHLKARLIQREKSHHQLEKKANMIKRPNLGFHRPIKTNTTIDTIQLAKTNVTSHIDSKFLNEDKEVHFNVQSFIEEFICQTLYAYINIFAWPFILPISKYHGALNAAYIPNFKSDHATRSFKFWCMNIFFNFVAAIQIVGIYVWTTQNDKNPNVDLLECCICTALFLLRMYVIGVKYAYLPRRNLITIRKEGRSAIRAGQEQILAWTDPKVAADSILYQLDLALWRSGNTIKSASEDSFFHLNNNIEKHMLQRMNDALKPDQSNKDDNKNNTPKSSPSFISQRNNSNNNNNNKVHPLSQLELRNNNNNNKRNDEISLRDILIYVAARATRKHAMPTYVWFIPFVAGLIGPVVRIILNKPPFGSTIFEIILLICNFIATISVAGSCISFAYATKVLFDRRWCMSATYFEFLIPRTHDDARRLEKSEKDNLLNKLPKLKGLARNVYLWVKGRDVFRNFGIEYVARCEHFLGAFFVIIASAGLYQTIRIFVGLSEETITIKVTTGNVLLAFWLISFLGAFVVIVLSGIRANKQLLLQRNAILRHVRRYKGELEFNRKNILQNYQQQGGEKAIAEAERVADAFVAIEKELKSESEVDMLRILSFPVDKKMLGAIFTLLGTVGATVGQILLLAARDGG